MPDETAKIVANQRGSEAGTSLKETKPKFEQRERLKPLPTKE